MIRLRIDDSVTIEEVMKAKHKVEHELHHIPNLQSAVIDICKPENHSHCHENCSHCHHDDHSCHHHTHSSLCSNKHVQKYVSCFKPTASVRGREGEEGSRSPLRPQPPHHNPNLSTL